VNSGGCADSISLPVHIAALPSALFGINANGLAIAATAVDSSLLSYSWDFGDGSKGAGFKTNHSYQKEGSYKVSLKVINLSGCEFSHDTTIYVAPLGIDDRISNASFFRLQPNPFSSHFTIVYESAKAGKTNIYLTDITGKIIHTILEENLVPGTYNWTFSGQELSLKPGTYFITLVTPTSAYTSKLLFIKRW
jgi:PKD repeat protein